MENYELKLPPLIKKRKPYKIEWTEEMLKILIEEFPSSYNNVLAIKTDPELVQRIKNKRNDTIAREKRRLKLGLPPLTKLKLKL